MKNKLNNGAILIVDDELVNLKILAELLKKQNYTIRTAEKGMDAIASVNTVPPDIILLDIMLPDKDGFDVCTTLKNNSATRDIPVIFISSLTQTTDILRGFAVGGIDYIPKPFIAEEVIARVKTHLEMRKMRVQLELQAEELTNRNQKILLESEEKSQEKINDLKLLSDATSFLLKIETREEIYTYLRDIIYPLSGADFMMVSTYNEVDKMISSKYILGIQPYIEKITKAIGLDVHHIKIPLHDLNVQRELALRKKIYWIEGGLFEFAVQKVPKAICFTIEKILGINDFFSIDIIWNDEYYGGVSFGFKKGNKFRKILLVDSIINQISLAFSRIQTKELLMSSEKKYRSIFENIQDVYYETDVDGTILEVSPSIELISKGQFKREELIGKSMYGYFLDGDVWGGFVGELAHHKHVENFEIILKNKDGSLVICSFKAELQLDSTNKPKKITGIFHDITERKRTEETIKSSEEKFNKAFQMAPVAMTLQDANGLFLEVNSAFVSLMGYTKEETVGQHRDKMQLWADENERQCADNLFNMYGALESFEFSFRKKSGKVGFGKLSSGTIILEGKPVELAIVLDITDHKRVVEELKMALEKATESDCLKSAFLANLSHEIRTPMNGILGFAQLLREPGLTVGEQKSFIQHIEKSSARMLNIITNIVNISKIESGQMEISISETNVNERIEKTYSTFKPEVEQKGIQFSFKTTLLSNDAIITSDREKIQAILNNLVDNAVKFTHTGSIEFGYERKGKFLEFFVKDSGVGIPQEKHEIIFMRFRQGSESLTGNYEGAGLGLSLAKSYVEMLGGKIWVVSELGKGSTFNFTIPHDTEPYENTVTKESVSMRNNDGVVKDLKILIVEDDESSELLLSTTLTMFCKEIFSAGTGVEAVEACRVNPDIDLVMMDVRMPDMDGYEATRQIRQFNKEVVIIAQTAFGLSGDREKAIEAGCDAYISKPIDITLLKALISKYFK